MLSLPLAQGAFRIGNSPLELRSSFGLNLVFRHYNHCLKIRPGTRFARKATYQRCGLKERRPLALGLYDPICVMCSSSHRCCSASIRWSSKVMQWCIAFPLATKIQYVLRTSRQGRQSGKPPEANGAPFFVSPLTAASACIILRRKPWRYSRHDNFFCRCCFCCPDTFV